MKILVYCPVSNRLSPKTIHSIMNQDGVESYTVIFTKDNPYLGDEKFRNIQLAYERLRTIGKLFDVVWIVEEDIVPPLNALSKMLSVNAPVVSGLYVHRHGNPKPNIFDMSNGVVPIGMPYEWENLFVIHKLGIPLKVSGASMGCLLVNATVLEHFSFILKESIPPDRAFMAYCQLSKINQLCCLDIQCSHIASDGTELHPSQFLKGKAA